MLQKIDPKAMDANFFSLLDDQWGLITAGTEPVNPMTVAWGGVGILWSRPVVTAYVRPQRYTFGLMNKAEYFSLSFLGPEHHKVLVYCGSRSGRDKDKMKETGLTLAENSKAPVFDQAELTLVCRKLYAQDIEEKYFLDRETDMSVYPNKDYHRMFIGEIVDVYRKG